MGLYSKEHQKYKNLNMGVHWLLMIMIVENMSEQEYLQQINLIRLCQKLCNEDIFIYKNLQN
jgi:hypothetical protein